MNISYVTQKVQYLCRFHNMIAMKALLSFTNFKHFI
jgi:hypothetical protein